MIGIILLRVVGAPLRNEIEYRIALRRLGHPQRYVQAILTLSRTPCSPRKIRGLETRLRQACFRTRWRAARVLKNWSYETDCTDNEFFYAISLGEFHRIPFETERVIEYALEPKHELGALSNPLNGIFSWVDPRIRKFLLSMQPLQATEANRYAGEPDAKAHARISGWWIRSLAIQGSVQDNSRIASYLSYPDPSVQTAAILALRTTRGYAHLDDIIRTSEAFLFANNPSALGEHRINGALISSYAARDLADDRWFPLLNTVLANQGKTNRNIAHIPIYFSSALWSRMDNKRIVRKLRTFLDQDPDHMFWNDGVGADFRTRVLENRKPVFPPPLNQPFKRVVLRLSDPEQADETQFGELNRRVHSLKDKMRKRSIGRQSSLELREELRELKRTNHPGLVPLLTSVSAKCINHQHIFRCSYDYLGRMKAPNVYLQLCSALGNNRAPWEGLAALGDSRAIPELMAWLPEARYFRWAAGTLQSIGWQPQNDEERSFLLLYEQDSEQLLLHQEMLGNFLRDQLSSTEVRRRDFAAKAIVGLGLDDLIPCLIKALETSGDGRIANRMHHSGHPILRAKAEKWIEAAPPGLAIMNRAREGWGQWH